MKQTVRKGSLIAASALLLGLTAPLAAHASTPAEADVLEWSPCGSGSDPRQECATLQVPLDYADPDGRHIDIAISRIAAEKPSARRGALLIIPGGPGGTSLADPAVRGRKMPQEVRDSYDLIGFAPRGNAPSTAVDCGLEHGDLALTKLRPWPAADGSVTGNMTTARRVSQACARNGGELIRHISTVDNARDIDRIRTALGERRISAWGISYGTYIGAVYAQLFPHHTDRIVLDSSLDPTGDHGRTAISRAWLTELAPGIEDTFAQFSRWASAPENPRRLADTPAAVRSEVLGLADRLDHDPLPWPGANPDVMDGNALRQAVFNHLYDPDDFPHLAQLILGLRQDTPPPAPKAPPEAVLQNLAAVSTSTICNDSAWPRSAAVYQKAVDRNRAKYPLTAGMPANAMPCAAWPFPPAQPPVPITSRGPSNILLVQNEHDVATPISGALRLRSALGRRAVMVSVDSTGHGAYLDNGNACGDQAVSRFLATGERPVRDLRCL
ncbi:alpha/beta hydrolase [Streptomyces sp. NPDC002499]